MAKKRISRNEFLHATALATGAMMVACAPQAANKTPTVEPTKVNQKSGETFPRVSLYQTQERSLSSHLVRREYQLAVLLPESYASSQTPYPILYLLDGDVYFGAAASFTQLMNWLDNVPELIIVGIGYNMKNYDEWLKLRELDFKIPEVQDEPKDSHADLFLSALKQEIIPFVETNYRVDPRRRILYGYSSSGFFALYTLFHEPNLFQCYLVGSGDTDLSAPYMPAHDSKLVSREKQNPIDLYLSVGSLEGNLNMQSSLSTFKKLVAAIKEKNYPGVRLTTEIYEGENHGAGGAALTYVKGLRNFFNNQ
jgi:uncharacterized protein